MCSQQHSCACCAGRCGLLEPLSGGNHWCYTFSTVVPSRAPPFRPASLLARDNVAARRRLRILTMRHCARATVSVALGVLALCGFLPAFAVAAGKCGTVGNPGLSCADIFDAGGSVGDGVYSVRAPDGTVHSVYCDMQAGGYQLVAKIARGDSSVTDVEGAWNDGAWWQRACVWWRDC